MERIIPLSASLPKVALPSTTNDITGINGILRYCMCDGMQPPRAAATTARRDATMQSGESKMTRNSVDEAHCCRRYLATSGVSPTATPKSCRRPRPAPSVPTILPARGFGTNVSHCSSPARRFHDPRDGYRTPSKCCTPRLLTNWRLDEMTPDVVHVGSSGNTAGEVVPCHDPIADGEYHQPRQDHAQRREASIKRLQRLIVKAVWPCGHEVTTSWKQPRGNDEICISTRLL